MRLTEATLSSIFDFCFSLPLRGTPKESHQATMFFTKSTPRPDSKGHRWLPDCMEESRPVRTKALYPIFADRRTRTGSVLKQFAGEGLT